MKEILRTNDPVELSWASSTLRQAGIAVQEFDNHTSIAEGSIGAIQRRLMVPDADVERARALIEEGPA